MPRLPDSSCLKCGQTFDGALTAPNQCPNCLDLKPQFDFATAALKSNDDTISLIHHLKLLKRPELSEDLVQIAVPEFRNETRFTDLDNPIVIPVPLHGQRYRERGFNQAETLARPLARELQFDFLNALKRVRATPRQATLSRRERLKNLKKAFQLRVNPEKLTDRNLIIIDDVFTTGSTTQECARALRLAKPRKIAVFTIVRA